MLGGAGLNENDKTRFREISEELSKLTLRFEENVLDETNSFELYMSRIQMILPGYRRDIIEMASMEAKKRNKEGWVFTLNYPSYVPFMQYSEKRNLREKMLKAYSSRAFHNNEKDNRSLVSKIVNLRLEIAKMLGFRNYAEMVLGDRMAEEPEKWSRFLKSFIPPHIKQLCAIFRTLWILLQGWATTIRLNDGTGRITLKNLRKPGMTIDDETLKPYFSLENVTEAIFGLASRLYGLRF